MKNQDNPKISNDYYEVKRAAKTLGVKPSVVYDAKEVLNTNNRKKIYAYIRSNHPNT